MKLCIWNERKLLSFCMFSLSKHCLCYFHYKKPFFSFIQFLYNQTQPDLNRGEICCHMRVYDSIFDNNWTSLASRLILCQQTSKEIGNKVSNEGFGNWITLEPITMALIMFRNLPLYMCVRLSHIKGIPFSVRNSIRKHTNFNIYKQQLY